METVVDLILKHTHIWILLDITYCSNSNINVSIRSISVILRKDQIIKDEFKFKGT